MGVPERLALIGGSILLASTLIFTLKGQASHILPKVDGGMTSLFQSDKDKQADPQKQQAAQEQQTFDKDYQQAQQNHWPTGTWGTAQYYIDGSNNFHVGSGQLRGALEDTLGYDKLHRIRTINLDGSAQAPQNSQNLFRLKNGYSDNDTTQINGLANLDTSQVTDMEDMFAFDDSLSNLDVSHFDTSNVNNMGYMFYDDSALSNLDVSHFDTSHVNNMDEMFDGDSALSSLSLSNFSTSNVTDMGYMFYEDGDLTNLNLSSFNTSDVTNMDDMFDYDNIKGLTLGSDTKLQNNSVGLSGSYQSNGQTLSLDGNAHPGTWNRIR